MNIEIKDGTIKAVIGDYVIYNRKWLYENLDMEFDILRSARKINVRKLRFHLKEKE